MAHAARRSYAGVNVVGSVNHAGEVLFFIAGSAYAFEHCVGHYRCRAVADHAAAVSGTRPFGEEAALTIEAEPAVLNFGTFFWPEEVYEGE